MKFVIGKKGLCVSTSLIMLIPLAFAFCMFPVKDVIVMVGVYVSFSNRMNKINNQFVEADRKNKEINNERK